MHRTPARSGSPSLGSPGGWPRSFSFAPARTSAFFTAGGVPVPGRPGAASRARSTAPAPAARRPASSALRRSASKAPPWRSAMSSASSTWPRTGARNASAWSAPRSSGGRRITAAAGSYPASASSTRSASQVFFSTATGTGGRDTRAPEAALLHRLHARLLRLLGRLLGNLRHRRGAALHAEALEELRLDLREHLAVLAQEGLRLLAPLADALAAEAEPGAAL